MDQLARIEARLHSLAELDDLVGALRSMAAARAREAQEAFRGTRAYTATVERAIAEVAPLAGPRHDPAGPQPGGTRVLLVVTSENGFVGGFNRRLIEHACSIRAKGEVLCIVGRRGQIAAVERRVTPQSSFAMTSRPAGVTALARRIALRLKGARTARVVFARYRSGAAFDIEVRPVLPLGRLAPPDPAALPPLHHLPPAALLADLAAEYLFAKIAHALMESLASENGARLRTMDAASRNISDKLEVLRRQERAARQEQTTSDMIDVVTGAEAVNHR